MAEVVIALQADAKDNVATVFAEGIVEGAEVQVLDPMGAKSPLVVRGTVPYGHKIALQDIAAGELIIKYGEEIGVATRDIRQGDYVHVHNLDSMRGRGDWEVQHAEL